MSSLHSYRYLILRRVVQVGILALFVVANVYGVLVLTGDLSAAKVFDIIPLTDPFAVLQMLFAGSLVAGKALIGAAIVLVFYGIIGGRAFCSWVCPVNLITDFAALVRRVFKLDVSNRKIWVSRHLRYWFLGLALVLSVANGIAAFEFVSPISMFHRGVVFGMGMGWAALISVFLFDVFALKDGWCGHMCPLGAFYSLVGKYSFIRVRHVAEKCNLCMDCKKICPEVQVLSIINKQSGTINSGECKNCLRCVEVCETEALTIGFRQKTPVLANRANSATIAEKSTELFSETSSHSSPLI